MALLALKTHSVGFAVALMFFGSSCVALGYLTFTSGFLPKTLGVLMAIAGACCSSTALSDPLSRLVRCRICAALSASNCLQDV